jgi:hypothetical protein
MIEQMDRGASDAMLLLGGSDEDNCTYEKVILLLSNNIINHFWCLFCRGTCHDKCCTVV